MTLTGRAIRQAVQKNSPPDFPIFCFGAVAVAAAQIGWAIYIDEEGLAAFRAIALADHPTFLWMDAYGRSFAIAISLSVFGGLIVASLFSNQHAVAPRFAWWGFAVWGLAMTAGNLWSAAGPVGGYANKVEVTWIDRRGVVDRQPWAAATGIVAGCAEERKSPRHRLRFDVQFGDRRAQLVPRGFVNPVQPWLANATAVASLTPSTAPFSLTSLEWRCVAHYASTLSLEDDRALVALFRPTEERAARIEKENAAWGRLFRQVAADRAKRRS